MARGRSSAPQRLVTTFVAAHKVGVSARTLQRWVAARRVEPAHRLPSGQYQWHVGDLRAQLATSPQQ